MSRRERVRLDYKVLHLTGQKVTKLDSANMDESVLKTLEIEALKNTEDVNHYFGVYAPEVLESVEEVNEAIDVLTNVSQKYRHIHVELKSVLGKNYNNKYPEYEINLSKITKFTREVRGKLNHFKDAAEVARLQSETMSRLSGEQVKKQELKIEEDVLDLKVSRLDASMDVALATDPVELEQYCAKMETFVSEYLDLSGKLKMCYSKDEYNVHRVRIDESVSRISDEVKMTKMLKQKLLLKLSDNEKANSFDFEQTKCLVKAKCLKNEISLRCVSLESKFDRELSDLSPYQLLEISQDKSLDLGFNEVLEKVTDLSSLVVDGCSQVNDILEHVTSKVDQVSSLKVDFQKNLSKILIDRDITPDKLKNASTLDIALPKYSGHDCDMDFFTFKSEFKKLKEPNIQKQYWADCLKKNHLTGSALALVEKETDYEKIWTRLHESYGNPRLLLQNKLSKLDGMGDLSKIKSDEKIAIALSGLINTMRDLSSLAEEHRIEGQLYEGGGLEKVLALIGIARHKKFRVKHLGAFDKKVEYVNLLEFIQQELQLLERVNLDKRTAQLMGLETKDKVKPGSTGHHTSVVVCKCHFCGEDGHTQIVTAKGNKIIPYYACEKFIQATAVDRLAKLKEKNLCTVCLYPGAKKGPRHRCFFLKYCCPHVSHRDSGKIHVLLCNDHKADAKNLELVAKFIEKFITSCQFPIPPSSRNISCFTSIVCVAKPLSSGNVFDGLVTEPEIVESAIFQLQTIVVGGISLKLFFDNGCGDMVVKRAAVEKLGQVGRAKQIREGPIDLSGVGDQKSICHDGVYSICLPLCNGGNAILTGLCLPKLTATFPEYDLTVAGRDLVSRCTSEKGHGFANRLPKLPGKVGGDPDIIVGVKFAKYLPKSRYECGDGFGIAESVFLSECGSRGVLYGPHAEFSKIERLFHGMHVRQMAYFMESLSHVRKMSMLSMSRPLLEGMKELPTMASVDEPMCCSLSDDVIESDKNACDDQPVSLCDAYASKRPPKCIRTYDEVEQAGTVVDYRCVDCLGCLNCKKGERWDCISIQEESEQGLIEKSVKIIPEKGESIARLPFVVNPDTRIDSDGILKAAKRVYRSQLRILNEKPDDLKAVIDSEAKLQSLGFVDFVDNLPKEEQEMILGADVRYVIPWRAQWSDSLSTSCRLVFDASMGSKDGCSLNTLLAKGANGMNKLVEIAIRWQCRKHAFSTDVSKMYNCVKLEKEHWRYQLYLWHDQLDPNAEPRLKVIKTCIYGVRPSGNQAECAIRRTAELSGEEFPDARDAICDDTYVDDCMSGTESKKDTLRVTDEIQVALAKGGFTLKGFSMSGEDPPKHLSADGKSVMAIGGKWFPKEDSVQLNIKPLNLTKKVRGKKSSDGVGKVPESLTMRDCSRVVHELYDICGKVAPLTASFKLDMSELHHRKLDWDDPIPAELRNQWIRNFDLMAEIGGIKFQRAVIPLDAISLEAETIDVADASEQLICAAIYVRYKLRGGGHSCQLIFARTKIIHDITMPRAELAAALLNASTGHVVNSSLKGMVSKTWKLTDSQVVLHWLNSTRTALKSWVRNRVKEITRLADRPSWSYVSSKDNIADLGTRRGATIEDVGPDGPWIRGLPWMTKNESEFPLKTVDDLVLSNVEQSEADKEKIFVEDFSKCFPTKFLMLVPKEAGDRYGFSDYLLDPNKFRFSTVVRILALVFLFIKKVNVRKKQFKFLQCPADKPLDSQQYNKYYVAFPARYDASSKPAKCGILCLNSDLICAARNYYFRKATEEIKEFVNPAKFRSKSESRDGILYYTGRILESQQIDAKKQVTFADACLDLSAASFCVPMTDHLSPVAYAIVMETHWFDPDVNHGGVESVLRISQNTAYIIGGRELVKSIRKSCTECRRLHKKGVRVAMGLIGDINLSIAPAFFICQVDICGPFDAYSPANKRATLKVYFVVFCCSTTGAVDCRVMEDYSTCAFILSFIRFSSRFGYPKTLLPDVGSQLVKGCEDMVLTFSNLTNQLFVEHGVDFKTCPVGAHNVHGKVERKIQAIKKSFSKTIQNRRLSILQWETLGQQVANSINNLPIGLKNRCDMLENMDLLTPNRLILGRNNRRNPTVPLKLTTDLKGIVESNESIVKAWFDVWLTSYVPTLLDRPKWFTNDRCIRVGDVVLFLKSDREFDLQYQYGLVTTVVCGRDGLVRVAEVQYRNHTEKINRTTKRSVRDLIVIHPVEELGIYKELHELATQHSYFMDWHLL